MDDLPVCKKCCFCLPLRYGLLLWGYLKLFAGFLVLFTLGIITYVLRRYLLDQLELVAVVFSILGVEIIIHILFIIGSHKKNVKLLKVYYYYSIFIWALTITIAIVAIIVIIVTMSHSEDTQLRVTLLLAGSLTFAFTLAMQTFLLFVLRSEIIKLRSNCSYRYVKETDDIADDIKTEDNPPED